MVVRRMANENFWSFFGCFRAKTWAVIITGTNNCSVHGPPSPVTWTICRNALTLAWQLNERPRPIVAHSSPYLLQCTRSHSAHLPSPWRYALLYADTRPLSEQFLDLLRHRGFSVRHLIFPDDPSSLHRKYATTLGIFTVWEIRVRLAEGIR